MIENSAITESNIAKLKEMCIEEYFDLDRERKDLAKRYELKCKEFDEQHKHIPGTAEAKRSVYLGGLSGEIWGVNKDIQDLVEFYTTQLGGKIEDFPRVINGECTIMQEEIVNQ